MGQFTEQVQQITSAQNEILTERKRKQLEKERKELLQLIFNRYKLKAIEIIEPLQDKPYKEIFYNEYLQHVFSEFRRNLKKYSFDTITIRLKEKELEDFTYKEIMKQKTRAKRIEQEEAKAKKQVQKQPKKVNYLSAILLRVIGWTL